MNRSLVLLAVLLSGSGAVSALPMVPPAWAPSAAMHAAGGQAADTDAHKSLKALCSSLFREMNKKNEGIFHEDISAAVASYFPVGQPIAETRKVVAQQRLGELKPFRGKPMAGEGAPFATSFHLMGAQYSDVEVVLHIDFKGDSDANYVVKSVHAYFRGTSM